MAINPTDVAVDLSGNIRWTGGAPIARLSGPPSSPVLAEPPPVAQTPSEWDLRAEQAAGFLGVALDYWPLSAAQQLYAHRDEPDGIAKAAPGVVAAAARAIGRHTIRELAYDTLKK